MTMAGTNMIWHGQKLNQQNVLNPNTLAIASGAFIVSIGITIKIWVMCDGCPGGFCPWC